MLEEKVTPRQIICLLTIVRMSTAISTMPTTELPPYNQDVWIMVLLSIVYTFVMMIPLVFLANKFKEYSIIGYIQLIYGKSIGKIIGFSYGLYFILNSINGTTIQSELVATTILDDASNIVVAIFMMITCIYYVSRGIIAFARTAEAFAPLIFIIGATLLLLGFSNVDFSVLKPILVDSPLNDISMGAYRLSFYYVEIMILAMIVPELENKKDINKIFVKSVIVSMVLLAIVVVMCQGTMGVEYTRHLNFPFLLYVRAINQFQIFERIDSIFIIVWLIASITRISAFLYLSVRAFRELFNKKEDEKLILIVIGLLVGIATLAISGNRSVIGIRKHLDLYYSLLSFTFILALPLLTCIIYFFRKKSLERKGIIEVNKLG